MPLPLVIINPTSARGLTGDLWPKIASDLRANFGPFNCVFTEKAGHASQLAAEAAQKGITLIIACGGDGTISEVANGILVSGKRAELGILPSGTGGDFRRTLRIPRNAREAARILAAGRSRSIDVGRVTFTNTEGEDDTRFFLGVASFGMSVDVIERVKGGGPEWLPTAGPGWLNGRISFAASMVQSAMQAPATRVVMRLEDGPERQLSVSNLCIANARYFGGGMKIAPQARLTDGQFDVVAIGDLGGLKILTNAPRIYLGSHLGMEKVSHALSSKLFVRPAERGKHIPIELDGELPGHLPATFQIVPQAMLVRCP